jgi:type I restriction enzyme M protein
MTNEQLKKLEKGLWDAANSLRAYGGIKAADYAVPVLGLIFLRFADNKYSAFEADILDDYNSNKGTRMERDLDKIAISKCGFFLPDYARYDYLLNLPTGESMAIALRKAMEGIEEYQDEKFKDVLPKEAFFEIEKKKDDILPTLLKTFSDIPKDASGDIFGKIYEYFLGEFAMSEGQKGGEFFTPTSVVRFIVEVIEPYAGKIYDPACGSGGMFVQSAKFVQEAKHDLTDIYVYGQEYMGETARLAKMNLLVNNIRGEITEVNSYESNPYGGLGKFDFVMANPPFNVKSVKESTVKNDERFYKYGLPKNKGKNTDDSITDANYLWVSLFATSLNDKGRAGFVMPNSASDAGNSEYDIRKKIVDSGIVDCMLSMPSNMFLTVTLPATLWFFDKKKVNSKRKDTILFIDARNTYFQRDRAHREWKEEHIQNLTAIVRLYRGENDRFLELVASYIRKANEALHELPTAFDALQHKLQSVQTNLEKYAAAKSKTLDINVFNAGRVLNLDSVKNTIENAAAVKTALDTLSNVLTELKNTDATLNSPFGIKGIIELWTTADKEVKQKNDKTWSELDLNTVPKALDELYQYWKKSLDTLAYWHSNIEWLQTRFPDAVYADVVGLCKVADRSEYAEEQDYSLNAGRYVGVEIEGDDMSKTEFLEKLKSQNQALQDLNKQAAALEQTIFENINQLLM